MDRIKITTALDKIGRILDKTQFEYCRIEIVNDNQSYIVEKNSRYQAGFKVGDTNE